jgi:hypothetical protein
MPTSMDEPPCVDPRVMLITIPPMKKKADITKTQMTDSHIASPLAKLDCSNVPGTPRICLRILAETERQFKAA